MGMTDTAAKDILRKTGWLAGEPDWLREALLSCARISAWKADELIYMVGDEPGGIYGIAEGGVGVLVPSGGNEMVLCHVLRPGMWFGLGPILAKGRRFLTFKTVEPSRTVHVTLADLNAIGARQPELFRRLGALSEASFHTIAIRVVGDLLISSGERRIAAVLARIAGAGPDGATWPIRVSQSMLGQMSNCSRDRVNQALRKFAMAGWISADYRLITVNDLASLEAFTRGGQAD
jgi:CRP/FNR family cyclic AMP-dependent transcriptional regulator